MWRGSSSARDSSAAQDAAGLFPPVALGEAAAAVTGGGRDPRPTADVSFIATILVAGAWAVWGGTSGATLGAAGAVRPEGVGLGG